MKIYKTLLPVCLTVLFISNSLAQGVFTTLDAQGYQTNYLKYDRWELIDGKIIASASEDKVQLRRMKSYGENTGVRVEVPATANRSVSLVSNYWYFQNPLEFVGHPDTYMLFDSDYNDALIAYDGLIIELDAVNNAKTDFSSIKHIFIPEGWKSSSSPKKNDKKKKVGGFLGKASKMLNLGSDKPPYYDELVAMDLIPSVKNYLKQQKAISSSYTLSSDDKDQLERLAMYKKKRKDSIAGKNADYWASPAGQKTLRQWGSMPKGNVTLKNNSGSDMYISIYSDSKNSDSNATKIAAGGSLSWSCGNDAYINGSSRKIYSKGTACNGQIGIK